VSENLDMPLSAATDEGQEREAVPVEDQSAPVVASAIHSYLNSVDPYKRAAAVAELARSNEKDAFDLIAKCIDDHSSHVRNAAVRGLLKINTVRTVELFNRVLEDGPEDRRRKIGNAIAASGLAAEAIDNLVSDNREDTYNALSILFVMAKTGEVQPLVQAIAEHPNGEVSEAALKLLTLSGKSEIASAALKQRANARAQGRGNS
jgi:HEAT repeat protein